MNAIEVDQLEPGTKTDALAAKAAGIELRENMIYVDKMGLMHLFDPSVHMNAAWIVQEAMYEKGYWISLKRAEWVEQTGLEIQDGFECDLIHIKTRIGCGTRAKTAQMAICKAVILLGGE